jgi:hypothetical protein
MPNMLISYNGAPIKRRLKHKCSLLNLTQILSSIYVSYNEVHEKIRAAANKPNIKD